MAAQKQEIVSLQDVYKLNLWRDRARVFVGGLIVDAMMASVSGHYIEKLVNVQRALELPFEPSYPGWSRGKQALKDLGRAAVAIRRRLQQAAQKGGLEWWS